ncbi:hypothetical protein BJ742DRAFT_779657 [Cladochytrium replicatum]|nr:hypothetical protein BJ742DRAFT_779657 [Cladochytrium replicatum]
MALAFANSIFALCIVLVSGVFIVRANDRRCRRCRRSLLFAETPPLHAAPSQLQTNSVSSQQSSYYAELYRTHQLEGARVIMLGSDRENDAAAKEALAAWPGELQIGGGITLESARHEFLDHAADVEGLCKGIDGDLVERLGEWSPIPCTFAGGANDLLDLELVISLSNRSYVWKSSSFDIFGGTIVRFMDVINWTKKDQ